MVAITLRADLTRGLTNEEIDANMTNLKAAAEAAALTASWSGITGKPATLAGFGITDAQPLLVSGTSIKTVNGQSVLGSGNIQIDGGVTSFNTRTGAVTLGSGDVTNALGYTPYNATNPSGFISGINSSMVTTALGFTPYNATNPSGYITASASITGNAASATRLINLRTINGVGFDGTANITVADATKLPLSGGTVAGVLIGNGGFANVDGGIRIANPGGASYATSASTVTGAIKIRLPAAALGSNSMISFRVRVYQYSTGLTQEFVIAGYNYSDAAGTWYNVSALNLSDAGGDFTVRFGKDATSQCVYIGELNSSWSYPQVHVVDFSGGYSGMAASTWATDWNISFETSAFAGVTSSRTAWRSLSAGNYNSYAPSLTGTGASGTWGINVTGNAATASTLSSGAVINGTAYFRKNQTTGDYTTASLWTESYGNTSTGIAFHISGVAGRYLEMRNNSANLFWNSSVILNDSNYGSYTMPLSGGATWNMSYFDFNQSNTYFRITSGPGTFYIGDDDIVNLGTGALTATPSSRVTSGVAHVSTQAYGVGQGDNRTHFGYNSGGTYVNYIRGAATYFDSGTLQIAGNQVLHAGNYSSYALPLSGGSVTGALNVSRQRLSFSSSYNDANHSIYNNYTNIDGEGSWDGMKMNVYDGLRIRTGNASGVTPTTLLALSSSSVRINTQLQVGQNTNGTAYIDAYGGYAWFGRDSNTAGIRIDGSGNVHTTGTLNSVGALTQSGNQVLHAGNYTNYLGDYGVGSYRVVADYASTNTWYIRSNGRFTWARAHDWTQAFELYLGDGTAASNNGWAEFGQRTSNNAAGTWFGTHFVQYAGGVTQDASIRAGRYYLGDNTNYVLNAGDGSLRLQTANGYVDIGPKNASWCHIYSDKDFYTNRGIWISGSRVLDAGNYSSYALPLSGGTVSGTVTLSGGRIYATSAASGLTYGAPVHIRDNEANGANSSYASVAFSSGPGADFSIGKYTNVGAGYLQIRNHNNTQLWTMDSAGNITQAGTLSATGSISTSSAMYVTGQTVLHAGNYSSYALPLSGGTVSSLTVTNNLSFNGKLTYYSVDGTSTSGQNRMAARLFSLGRKIYLDETFTQGINGISVYDNAGTGTVSITRVSSSGLNAPNNSGYVVQIQHTGSAQSPGYGGFYFGVQTRANATLACVFRAKLPAGYSLNWASNSTGSGGTWYWVTDNVGTGKWEDYVCVVRCGDSGSFSSTHFFYVSGGPAPSAGSPLTWYLSSATVYDVDDRDNINTNGYQPLHAGNYNSYALPLSGGTLSGGLVINSGSTNQLQLKTSTGTQSLWIRAGYDSDGSATPAVSAFNVQFQSSGSSGGTFSFVSGNTKVLAIGGGAVNSLVALQQNGNQVLHAGNYSSYALSLGGGAVTGASVFKSNLGGYSGSLNSPSLQVYSDSNNSAFMSFHRGGYYAVNMGLDQDNVIRIGGWSAPANLFQMDMAGNLTMANNVTAYSDERLKTDWLELRADYVERLAEVKSGTYTRVDNQSRQAGSSAQAWLALLPEVVQVGGDEAKTLSLAYGNAALVSAVELAKKAVAQEARIKRLEELVSRLLES